MGLLDALAGNAGEISPEEAQSELDQVLIPNEEVGRAYRFVRDLMVFTDRRLILVDHQGMSGKKTSYTSFPYRSVRSFRIETAGRFDRDAEVTIWISGGDKPIHRQLTKGTDVSGLQAFLADRVLG